MQLRESVCSGDVARTITSRACVPNVAYGNATACADRLPDLQDSTEQRQASQQPSIDSTLNTRTKSLLARAWIRHRWQRTFACRMMRTSMQRHVSIVAQTCQMYRTEARRSDDHRPGG